MSKHSNYYSLLGLPRDATLDEIRKAYFQAARRLHPDKNVSPGETEIFLGVQEAYEVLSDLEKRAGYDASLPPERPVEAPVLQKVLFSRRSIPRMAEPQLLYVLLEYSPLADSNAIPTPPLNLCLVLDRSTSMQGVNMDVVKATAIQILRRMRDQDTFAVVAFSDRSEVIIPAARNVKLSKLEARIQMLQTSGGTEIYQGLEAGFSEVLHNHSRSSVNHIILITDGRTYGDENKSLELAERAAKQGIGISGLGIGHEWNDVFLDKLALQTGGSSFYVSQPKEIEHLLLEKFNHLWQIYAEDVTLDFKTGRGVQLRYAFRIQPEVGLLSLESPLRLGSILRNNTLTLLMEFMIEPEATRENVVVLMEANLAVSIFSQTKMAPIIPLRLTRPSAESVPAEPPPQEIIHALSRLTLYRMQDQARLEVSAGQYERASKHLQQLATHLVSQGERGLAHTALLEAENIQKSRGFSKEGEKKIKYGTRALMSIKEKKRK